MPLPQRGVTINRENPTRVAKSHVLLSRRPTQRPILGEVAPPNPTDQKQSDKSTTQSQLLKKPSILPPLCTRRLLAPSKALQDTKENSIASSSKQIQDILDVDANDGKNLFLVSEYTQDIFKYLNQLEIKYTIQEKHLFRHQTTARMRSVLINWIVDVCINFKLLQETLYLTINIIDRYLQINKTVGRDALQLVGVAAMMVASKYEEIYVPAISDFVYICDNAFTAKQIFKTEKQLLNKLKFNLGVPLSLHFLRRFSKIASSDNVQHNLGKYFLEVFLIDYDICSVKPSLQAAAACCLALCVLKDKAAPSEVWNKTLEHYSTYKYAVLEPIIGRLVVAFRKMENSEYLAIKKKFASAKLDNISNHSALTTSKALKNIYEKALIASKH